MIDVAPTLPPDIYAGAPQTLSDPPIKKAQRTDHESLYPEDRFGYSPLHPNKTDFEIIRKDENNGFGVICYASFEAGRFIAEFTGEIINDIRQHSLQISPGVHIHDVHFVGYLLHSCSPNVYLDMLSRKMYAIRKINPGDYLYMDYAQTEDELFCCFRCCCQSVNCRGWITGRNQKPDFEDENYKKFLVESGKQNKHASMVNVVSPPGSVKEAPSEEDIVLRSASPSIGSNDGSRLASFWWTRDSLSYDAMTNHLMFAGRDVNALAEAHGTPCFFYDGKRALENVARIQNALIKAGFSSSDENGKTSCRVMYAMKANRYAPLLTMLKTKGNNVGIDACSPNEVEHAMGCGFEASDISFTNTSLSRKDLDRLSSIPELMVNLDSLHAIRKWGEIVRSKGSTTRYVGIRVNPSCGLGRTGNDKLQYCGGSAATKFGIYKEQLPLAKMLADEYGLKIVRVHFHTGCGYLTKQLPVWDAILEECTWFVKQLADTVETVNIGGGLGVPYVEGDEPLDMDQWASVLAKHFGDHANIRRIQVEPGAYVVQDTGVLLLTVNSVEVKQERTFVGVNGGFNLALEPAVYNLPFEPIPAILKPESSANRVVSIAGHINEALDVFYHDKELACALEEDDVVAFMNAGAYSSSMASNHCMRGEFKEFLLI